MLISQHRVLAELYTRGEDNRWTLTDFTTLTDSLTLARVDCTLALAEVYDKMKTVAA
jgi:hypothetical protein